MNTAKLRILGLFNILITGTVTGFAMSVYITGLEENSKCEYCSMMLYPGILFFILLFPGVITLFSSERAFNKRKTLLNIFNGIGILLSLAAILFNVISSLHTSNG